jgi:hypothetical protein
MRRISRAGAILIALATAAFAAAEGSPWPGGRGPFIGVDLMVGTPSAGADVFRNAFPGISLRYLVSRNFEVSLDYAFMDVGYYYPESGAGPWEGPVPWSSIPSRFEGMKDSWIFYHTKHFLAPQLWYVAPLDELLEFPLSLRVGLGPAISFLVPNESAKYYPGLSDAFALFNESFDAYLGLSVRLGLEYKPRGLLRIGAEYLFVVDSLTGLAAEAGRLGLEYFRRAGNLVIYTGLRI